MNDETPENREETARVKVVTTKKVERKRPPRREHKRKGIFAVFFDMIIWSILFFFRIVWFFLFWGAAISFAAALTIYIGPICNYPNQCGVVLSSPEKTANSEYENVMKPYAHYSRSENVSYLSYPKWYIQYNSKEYADFIQTHPVYEYPYLSSIMQFWQGYCAVYGLSKGPNPGKTMEILEQNLQKKRPLLHDFDYLQENLSVFIMGTLFTIENLGAAAFENTIGRFTEIRAAKHPASMDKYEKQMAKEYADFAAMQPWYKYPFWERMKKMWDDNPAMTEPSLRNIDRKVNLTISYTFKAIYANEFNKKDPDNKISDKSKTTYLIIGNASKAILENTSNVTLVKQIDDKTFLVTVPRFYQFTSTLEALQEKGVEFKEIEGNSNIFLTAIVPKNWPYGDTQGTLVFCQPILSRPEFKRVGIKVPVAGLNTVLQGLNKPEVKIERVYDY